MTPSTGREPQASRTGLLRPDHRLHPSPARDPVLRDFFPALEARHRENLSFAEISGAQTLSSLYVERRDRLARAGLRQASKRAPSPSTTAPSTSCCCESSTLGAAQRSPADPGPGFGTFDASAAWGRSATRTLDSRHRQSGWALDERAGRCERSAYAGSANGASRLGPLPDAGIAPGLHGQRAAGAGRSGSGPAVTGGAGGQRVLVVERCRGRWRLVGRLGRRVLIWGRGQWRFRRPRTR